MRSPRGFTLLELLVVTFLIGFLAALAIPFLNPTRLAMTLETARQQVTTELHRARWMAMNSGRPATNVELTSETVLSITDGTTVLASVDVSEYGVTLASDDELPIVLDSRGMQPGGAAKSLTVTSPGLGRSVTITIGPLGKVEDS